MKDIISEICWPRKSSFSWTKKQTAKKYGTTRENMSMAMNKGFKTSCKAVTSNVFTVVGLLVEPITATAKPNGYLEVSTFIRQT